MKNHLFTSVIFLLLHTLVRAQSTVTIDPYKDTAILQPAHVTVKPVKYKGRKALRVVELPNDPGEQFVRIDGLKFKNGVIETTLAGCVAPGAFEGARGFVGIAFRIADDDASMECFYLRPTNGRSEDQLRRNHSVQYTSSPDYTWQRLRKESAGKYESYVDLEPCEWTKIKIIVTGDKAQLFVHDSKQPTLIVNDLKRGADVEGAIGLWIGLGTEAYFSKVHVKRFE